MPATPWSENLANFEDAEAFYDDYYEQSYVGVPQNCLGAIVIEGTDGRWKCEHGRGPHVTDTIAALDCLKNCDYEGDEAA